MNDEALGRILFTKTLLPSSICCFWVAPSVRISFTSVLLQGPKAFIIHQVGNHVKTRRGRECRTLSRSEIVPMSDSSSNGKFIPFRNNHEKLSSHDLGASLHLTTLPPIYTLSSFKNPIRLPPQFLGLTYKRLYLIHLVWWQGASVGLLPIQSSHRLKNWIPANPMFNSLAGKIL